MSIALILGPPVASASTDGSLFRPTADDTRATGIPEPWELRRRLVSVNEHLLRPYCDPPSSGVPEDLTLNLFPDVTLTAVAEKIGRTTRAAGIRWVGGVRDVPDSSVTLTALRLCDGVPGFSLSGSARINGEEYTIEPRSGGRVAITEIDTLALGLLQQSDHLPRQESTAPAPLRRTGDTVKAGHSVIDVLMLYTPGAVQQADGKDEIEAWISDAAERANDNLADSGVDAGFRVVGLEEVAYTGSETVQPAFAALTTPKDGQLDDAPALRERYGADVVTTVVKAYDPRDGIAGLASYPENPKNPATSQQIWSVVAANQLWAYVLGHEWGHLLGLDHDWITSPERNPAYPDNHGHVAGNGSFVTIMGYPSACEPRPCPYAGYFANPAMTYRGQALGIRLGGGSHPADNARVMNLTAPQVAAYRKPQSALPDQVLKLTAGIGGQATVSQPGPYSHGDTTTATATPAAGYVFYGWYLDGAVRGSANPLSISMNTSHELEARFVKGTSAKYRLGTAMSISGAGTLSLNPPGPVYDEGTLVRANARVRTGYRFNGWLLDGQPAGDDAEISVTMSRDHTLTARYDSIATAGRRSLSVSMVPGWGGNVILSDPTSAGDVVAQARPAAGFRFTGWKLDGLASGTQPVLSLTITGVRKLVAEFAEIQKPPAPVKKKPPVKKKR